MFLFRIALTMEIAIGDPVALKVLDSCVGVVSTNVRFIYSRVKLNVVASNNVFVPYEYYVMQDRMVQGEADL